MLTSVEVKVDVCIMGGRVEMELSNCSRMLQVAFTVAVMAVITDCLP